MPFRPKVGWKGFFIAVFEEDVIMSAVAELDESVNYTPIQSMRHSAAHVMAEAVLAIFTDAKLAIGPAIEDGFYHDFDLPRTLTSEHLPYIEQRMRCITAGKYPFIRDRCPREKALEYFPAMIRRMRCSI